jgi:lipopolysaccharide export LptBFGC system permease protein LptF
MTKDENQSTAQIYWRKALLIFTAAFGLAGYPLGVLVVADGSPLVGFGVYVFASVLVGLAVTLWKAMSIVEDSSEVNAV